MDARRDTGKLPGTLSYRRPDVKRIITGGFFRAGIWSLPECIREGVRGYSGLEGHCQQRAQGLGERVVQAGESKAMLDQL
jgi:hypothetical protein